jgi:hypothetical protein
VGAYRYVVPGAGVEPARSLAPRDFKSLMYTDSITRAQQNVSVYKPKNCQSRSTAFHQTTGPAGMDHDPPVEGLG